MRYNQNQNKIMKVGVFDSGLGGEIVSKQLAKFFPNVEFITAHDRANLPYGNKTADEIIRLTDRAIQKLLSTCQIIVIACNTATAAAISTLRTRYPNVYFIGFEPAIKPAASDTELAKIMVLATDSTLRSNKYIMLKRRWAGNSQIIEPNCSTWAEKIEQGTFSKNDLMPIIDQARAEGVNEIVLGCTHYLAIENDIKQALPKVKIQAPINSVARRLKEIMLKYEHASSDTSRD